MPKKGKTAVLIIPTVHDDGKIDPDSDAKCKREVIKGGVETAGKLCADYCVARNTCWWPVIKFYFMFNELEIYLSKYVSKRVLN
jgi:hypothetical protein